MIFFFVALTAFISCVVAVPPLMTSRPQRLSTVKVKQFYSTRDILKSHAKFKQSGALLPDEQIQLQIQSARNEAMSLYNQFQTDQRLSKQESSHLIQLLTSHRPVWTNVASTVHARQLIGVISGAIDQGQLHSVRDRTMLEEFSVSNELVSSVHALAVQSKRLRTQDFRLMVDAVRAHQVLFPTTSRSQLFPCLTRLFFVWMKQGRPVRIAIFLQTLALYPSSNGSGGATEDPFLISERRVADRRVLRMALVCLVSAMKSAERALKDAEKVLMNVVAALYKRGVRADVQFVLQGPVRVVSIRWSFYSGQGSAKKMEKSILISQMRYSSKFWKYEETLSPLLERVLRSLDEPNQQ
jgi:hypothetical protein